MSAFDEAKAALIALRERTGGVDMDETNDVAERIVFVGMGVGERADGTARVVLKINNHLFSASVEEMVQIMVQVADGISLIGPILQK